jgi:hypothetical protein
MKKLSLIFLLVVLMLSMILPAGIVSASSPVIEVNGDFVLTFVGFGDVEQVGNNPVWLGKGWTQQLTYIGEFEATGTELLDFRWNTNSLAFNSIGTATYAGPVTIKGTTYQGGFTSIVRHIGFDEGFGGYGWCRLEETILSGTGDLANLHGTFHFTIYRQPDGSWTGTYSGKLHFAS